MMKLQSISRLTVLLLLSLFLSSNCWAVDYCADGNCQGCWLFTEGSGESVADDSQNTNTGVFKGAGEPAWDSDVPDTFASGSVLFDGENDYIEVANHASLLFGTGDFTVVAWNKSVASPTDSYPAIIGKGDTGSGEWMLRMVSNSTGKPGFYADAGTIITTGGSDMRNNWRHVASVIDSGNTDSHLYQTGTLISNDFTASVDLNDTTNLRLGNADGDTRRFWDGYLTEIAVFDRILTITEVNDIMDNGLLGAAAAGVIKTLNGLAWASVKTFNGVAVANIKTINGAASQ